MGSPKSKQIDFFGDLFLSCSSRKKDRQNLVELGSKGFIFESFLSYFGSLVGSRLKFEPFVSFGFTETFCTSLRPQRPKLTKSCYPPASRKNFQSHRGRRYREAFYDNLSTWIDGMPRWINHQVTAFLPCGLNLSTPKELSIHDQKIVRG